MGKKNTIGGKGYKKKKAGGGEFDRKPLEFAETDQKYALVTKMLGGCRVECKLYGGGSIGTGSKTGNSGNGGVGGASGMAIGVIRGAMRKKVYINPNDVIIVLKGCINTIFLIISSSTSDIFTNFNSIA